MLIGGILIATQSPIAGGSKPKTLRAVRSIEVSLQPQMLYVASQGTVAPRTETEMMPEVSGPVVWMSPALVSGGYFAKGAPLLRIDARDYAAAVARARAVLARADAEYELAHSELGRRTDLARRSVVSQASLDSQHRAERVADATLREARVSLEQAQRDLERTEIVAPFSGRVREEQVDVGQFLNRGARFATLYATDSVEIRLPIPDEQLAYLELPLQQYGELPEQQRLSVDIVARFAGAERRWRGEIVRTEGEIDAQSRMVHVVARVTNGDPAEGGAEVPLPVGLFVQARISGRSFDELVVLPRQALRGPASVLVIDADGRLRMRAIEVLRIDRDRVLITSGLEAGERVCISEIDAVVDGMQVRDVPMPAPPERVDES
jgi:RND family efflux transporter MFP subunit